MSRPESVWVAAFNRWMPTGYVEGEQERRLATIVECINRCEAQRIKAEMRRDRLEFYPKLRTRYWNENTSEWDTAPKRRPGARSTAAWGKVAREIKAVDEALRQLRGQKAKLEVTLSSDKAQRRAEFLQRLTQTPEWRMADWHYAKRLEDQAVHARVTADDDEKGFEAGLQRIRDKVTAGKVTEDWEVDLQAYAAAAQRPEPLTVWQRFMRWCRS